MTPLPCFSEISLDKTEAQLVSLIANCEQKLESLLDTVSEKSWENFIQPLEEESDYLSRFWSIIAHLHAVDDSSELRGVYEACIPHLTAYGTRLGHHRGLFEATQALSESADFSSWPVDRKKTIVNDLRDFKLAGVDLSAEKKAQMQILSQELAAACTHFSNNVLDATQSFTIHLEDEARLTGVPAHVLDASAEKARAQDLSGYVLTLDFPVYYAVQSYGHDRALRQSMHEAYVSRASEVGPQAMQHDNSALIHEIMKKRFALATCLGFKDYADYALATKMATSAEQVIEFLTRLAQASLQKATVELEELQSFASTELKIDALAPWDMAYATEALRQSRYSISQEELRQYFQVPKVLDRLFLLVKELFDLTVVAVTPPDTWHSDVLCFQIVDHSGVVRSYFYMDLYARNGKRGGAWMSDLQGRRRNIDGSLQVPVALINCNFSPPTGDSVGLLAHDDVETLFHEFGHALQHMLTQVDSAQVAGINGIPWDAVEFPSQFFENWAWEPTILAQMSAHFETDLPLPKELIEKMQNARHFQAAMRMLRQVEFAIFDMRLHTEYTEGQASIVQDILDSVRKAISVVPVATVNRFQNGFSHIFDGGYAAGYYSYKWAEVMAIDAFSLCREAGLFDQKWARLFLQCVLEPGGSEDPAVLFRRLAGRDPDPDALLVHDQIIEAV